MKTGIVYLIGAGCGGADLITLRGLERLGRCDAVVYDDLVDPALLELAPAGAQYISMGKRQGRPSPTQEEINRQLIALAREGKKVARLKGGDPFVFGRGGEEALALREAGIPWEVIPGVSSAVAIPGLAGIPVTHRGVSRSLHIVTAHTAGTGDALPDGLEKLAALEGTLVFLMGLSRLPLLARRLMEAGKAPDTPAAVISGGDAPRPGAVRGPLCRIAELTGEVRPPAVIVVGDVAGLELSPPPGPLEGVTVGLTGTAEIQEKLRRGLSQLGARPVSVGRTLVEELPLSFDWSELAEGGGCWVVLTSANGVRLFFQRLAEASLDLRRLHRCRFAVIGPATGRVLEERGLYPDLCPEEFTGRGLARALRKAAKPGEKVFLFRSARGNPILPDMLTRAGLTVREVPLYDLKPDPEAVCRGEEALPALRYLVFSSAGGVELFFRQYGAVPPGAVCVCIGEVTAAALESRGVRSPLTAWEISARGIIQAVLEDWQGRG